MPAHVQADLHGRAAVRYAQRVESDVLHVAGVLLEQIRVGHPVTRRDDDRLVRLDGDAAASLLGVHADDLPGLVLVPSRGRGVEQDLAAHIPHAAQDGEHVRRAAVVTVHRERAHAVLAVFHELLVLEVVPRRHEAQGLRMAVPTSDVVRMELVAERVQAAP